MIQDTLATRRAPSGHSRSTTAGNYRHRLSELVGTLTTNGSGTAKAVAGPDRSQRKIKPHLVASNLAQLADLLQSGVSLLGALDILAQHASDRRLAEVLHDVRDQVAEGQPLEKAMARHPHAFSELTVSLVHAGSEGAFLEDALRRIADFLQHQEDIKARVVGAMTYPLILAGTGFLVTFTLIVFFVPKFAELFARLEERGGLPVTTSGLLWLSGFLGSPYGILLAALCAGLVVWLRRAAQSQRGRLLVDGWKIKVPLAGKIFLNLAISRFCRVLGTLLKNGVPILRSLDISGQSSGNRILAVAIRSSAENISAGEPLAQPLAQCGLIPPHVMAMIGVAEQSNNLDEVLVQISEAIDRQTNRQLDLMVRLVEPLMLLVMAAVILLILVALLLPVFEMSATVG